MNWLMNFLFRKLVGPPNTRLDWDMLKTLLRDGSQIERHDMKETESSEADLALQFRAEGDSVKYFRSNRANKRVESLDVYRRGQFGFAVTFHDDIPVVFTRIGGRERHNPQFPPPMQTALLGLLHRVRKYADKK